MEQTHASANHAKGHAAAVFTVFVWGVTFVCTKILLRSFAPIEILFFRFIMGYAALWIAYPKWLKTRGFTEEKYFIGAGLCGITLYYLLENIALTYTLASNIGIILSAAPLFTALLATVFLKNERFSLPFVIGFAVAIAGIVLIATASGKSLDVNPIGDLMAITAALTWALYSILTRKIGSFGYNNIQMTRRIFFYGLLFMLPTLPLFGFEIGLERFSTPVNLFTMLFLGLGASAVCFATWNYAVNSLGAVKTSAYIYAVPVINITAAMIVLGERLTMRTGIGAILTLAGLAISEIKFSPKRADQ